MSDQELTQAFDALRAVVEDLVQRDRKTLVQGVKPALQTHTGNTFDERSLGFDSFGAFIRAAVDRGVVRQRRVRGGWLVEPITGPTPTQGARSKGIRSDLWTAFTDWSGRKSYAWAIEDGRVEVTPAKGFGGSANSVAHGNGLVAIPAAAEADHVDWAKEFLGAHNQERRTVEALNDVLNSQALPYAKFALMIRSNPRLESEWKAERRERVEKAIREWATNHGLTIDLRAETPEPPSLGAVTTEFTEEEATSQLRNAVKLAIDRMPASELRELRLPVGSLEGTGI